MLNQRYAKFSISRTVASLLQQWQAIMSFCHCCNNATVGLRFYRIAKYAKNLVLTFIFTWEKPRYILGLEKITLEVDSYLYCTY